MEHGRREHETPRREPRQRKSTRRGIIRRIGFAVGTILLVGICTTAMLGGIFMMYVRTTLAPSLQVDADDYTMNLSSIIYYQDRETQEWVEYQTVHGEENRIWVDIEQIPDALWQAAVAIEDERFFEHSGVDWIRTAGATANMFLGFRDTYGGSTLTQQVLKNMTGDNEGTVNRKVREIFRALEFEKNYTKSEILELYLNTIYLGMGCYGVQTAAEYYFGKDVSELDAAECASLIAITNNPSMYGPMYDITITREDGSTTTPREANKKRQGLILDKMAEVSGPATLEDAGNPDSWEPYLTQEEAEAAKAQELQFTDGSTSAQDLVAEATGDSGINSWFVDQVLDDVSKDLGAAMEISSEEARVKLLNGGYNIYTTLDPEIQEIAESVYEDRGNLNNLTSASGQLIHSAITIIEPSTGNIVAMVGDMGKKEGNRLWNYATDIKQPGSSIKPLTVYAPALDAGAITMASTFDNYPVRLLNGTAWPKNSPPGYSGLTTLSHGVAQSINTVAVRALERVGVSAAYTFATENLSLNLAPEDMDESPLGLGGLTYGLSTVEMAAAYATFANSGIYNEPRTYLRVTKPEDDGSETVVLENEGEQHVAMKETTAYFMNNLLTNAVSSGTGRSARFSGMTIAGKTGTTNDNYARYFVGYTPYYVAAVWTGYKENERISYSGNPAITLWKKVMEQVHADLPNKSFASVSGGLTSVTVCKDSGLRATEACAADPRGSRVWTVTVASGTEPTEECGLHTMVGYCTEGQCLAGEFCPEGSVEQRAYLNYEREDFGVVADDNDYLLSTLEKAVEESGGCPIHTEAADPNDPDRPLDPDDPGQTEDPGDPDSPPVDPENPGQSDPQDPEGGNSGESDTSQQPDPNDPTGGFGDAGGDWWTGFWDENSGG